MSASTPSQGAGWYGKSRTSEAERSELARQVAEWRNNKIALNYRQIAVEAPGKMILALGLMAQEKGIPFGDFVEGILVEFLEREGVAWNK